MKNLACLISTASILAIAAPANALYTFSASSGATVDPAGTLVAGSNDTNEVVSVTVPFNFSIYSNPVAANSTIRVSTEGNIQFVSTGGSIASSNTGLLATTFGSNVVVVMPYWDNLNLNTTGGGIYTSTSGTAGNQIFAIEWRGRHSTETALQTLNFEVRFFEGSNNFEIVYGQTGNASSGSALNGASATVGIQQGSAAGSQFTQYSFNQPTITPGLRLSATAVPVPFAFSPFTAIALMGANGVRRVFQAVKSEKY
ncbi:hypothetical protein ACQ4M3_20350 [Leptolyngbya sp. AN03gr2]|uniref:hypothetical protein n=1 Tax=unclassified Leptolyngbya TaxID=2650499 RepID=UPI003D30FAA8